jgi:hypothetical protein
MLVFYCCFQWFVSDSSFRSEIGRGGEGAMAEHLPVPIPFVSP